jgi:hypothetical protein
VIARSKSLLDSDRFTFRLYKRTLPKGELLAKLPLAKLARAKAAKPIDGFEGAEKLRGMILDAYFT